MAEAKKGRGCFFYGCITMIVVVIVGIVGIYFGARYVVKKAVDLYTSKTPVAIAPVKLPAAEGERAQTRLDDFTKSFKEGKTPEPLTLTSDELDYLVRNSVEGKKLKDSAQVIITNDQIRAQISMPLGAIRPELSGRFLNGVATLSARVRNGAVVLDLDSVDVNGQPLPKQFLDSMRKQPIEWRPDANDRNAALIQNIGRIETKDGKLVLYPKEN
jgi:hypothetical protein